jgi:hypothetical protein
MKIKKLLSTHAIAMFILVVACSKDDNNSTDQTPNIIAGNKL